MASRSYKSVDVAGDSEAGTKTRNCSTLAELHAVIPLSFRPTLGANLTKVYRIATKLGTVGNTIAQYQQFSDHTTIPPFIKNTVKVPKIQFSNEFDGTPEGRATPDSLQAIIDTARLSYLKEALKRKKQEQTALQNLLKFDEEAWKKEVLEVASRVAASLGAVCQKGSDGKKLIWGGASIPAEVKTEVSSLYDEGSVYHFRAIAIARAIADKTLLQRVKNLTLKEKAASDAMDIDNKDSSVQNAIDDALKKFKDELSSGAITIKTKTTAAPKGGRRKGNAQKPSGGRNTGKVNKPQPKKKKKKAGKI